MDYQHDNNYEEIVTSPINIQDNGSYTIARVVEEGKCAELHYCDGESTVEYMTETSPGEWHGRIEDVDWFNLKLSDDYILSKLSVLFNEEYNVIELSDDKAEELNLLDKILNKHKVYDIEVDIDYANNLIALDDENVWINEEFYKFLFDELFVYGKDGKPDLINDSDYEKLQKFQESYQQKEENNKSEEEELEYEK